MNLEELRLEIDRIDSQIVRLIVQRESIAQQISREKRRLNKNIENKMREQSVLDSIKKVAKAEQSLLDEEEWENIFRQIIAACKRLETEQ